jgi:hypothetical protein
MRKQDRMTGSQPQGREPQDTATKKGQPEQAPREQVKGSASPDQSNKPQRQPGRLPLPD